MLAVLNGKYKSSVGKGQRERLRLADLYPCFFILELHQKQNDLLFFFRVELP